MRQYPLGGKAGHAHSEMQARANRDDAATDSENRSTAFGVFDTGFGVAWFAGSAIMGLLYDKSILALILFSVTLQFLALPLLAIASTKKALR